VRAVGPTMTRVRTSSVVLRRSPLRNSAEQEVTAASAPWPSFYWRSC